MKRINDCKGFDFANKKLGKGDTNETSPLVYLSITPNTAIWEKVVYFENNIGQKEPANDISKVFKKYLYPDLNRSKTAMKLLK